MESNMLSNLELALECPRMPAHKCLTEYSMHACVASVRGTNTD